MKLALSDDDVAFREEATSRVWATGYDFPALTAGKVVKREFPSEKRPLLYGTAMNQRRERFSDVRVRRAIALCFDFEWTNKSLFYGLYDRSQSNFEKSDFAPESSITKWTRLPLYCFSGWNFSVSTANAVL